jgi:hypothetical protein
MIFLFNKTYVIWEVIELARLHICEVLRIPPSAVEAKINMDNSGISPEFNVSMEACEGAQPEQIREVIESIYQDCKEEMHLRLVGVSRTRDDVLRELRCEPQERASNSDS